MHMPKTILLFITLVCTLCAQASYPVAKKPQDKITFTKGVESSVPSQIVKFTFPDKDDPYLMRLRSEFHLENVISKSRSDLDRVRSISKWVRSRWEHNGNNTPENSDPISILQEAAKGTNFRCVEYAKVVVGALNSVGIPARIVGLMMQEVETIESGAGHVVAEAFLADLRTWVMIDGQWDVIPTLKGKPLSTVRFALALNQKRSGIRLLSFSKIDTDHYMTWIEPYLYYFRASSITSYNIDSGDSIDIILGPSGSHRPSIFQRKYDLGPFRFSHSIDEFYNSDLPKSLTIGSTRTPPALSPALSQPPAISSPLGASGQAGPVSPVR
jgi:hypothetical protein